MSRHNSAQNMFGAPGLPDPGNAGNIAVERSPCVIALRSLAAETRTVLNPTRAGAILLLQMQLDGGDVTVTFATAYNEDGDTVFTFSDVGQFAAFISFVDSAGAYYWRKFADYNTGNLTPGDANEVVITTNAITAAENGKTFYLDLAAGFVTTLPAPAAGLRFRFIVKTAPTGAPYVINTPTANIIYGMFVQRADGAGVAGAAQDTVNLVHNQAIIGDWAEFDSDGVNWYVHGMVNISAGVTFAAT